jgi:hypothetical protein
MRLRVPASIAGSALLALPLTGCMQVGEYAMGIECDRISSDIVEIVEQELGSEPAVENVWAGESDVWCRFDVLTGLDLEAESTDRDRAKALVEDRIVGMGDGISVTIVYETSEDAIST